MMILGRCPAKPGVLHWHFADPGRIMIKPTTPQRKTPSPKALLRAVASSTAVETGRPVAQLEQKLQQPVARFAHIKLAR
jgi:hypothetical protein